MGTFRYKDETLPDFILLGLKDLFLQPPPENGTGVGNGFMWDHYAQVELFLVEFC